MFEAVLQSLTAAAARMGRLDLAQQLMEQARPVYPRVLATKKAARMDVT